MHHLQLRASAQYAGLRRVAAMTCGYEQGQQRRQCEEEDRLTGRPPERHSLFGHDESFTLEVDTERDKIYSNI